RLNISSAYFEGSTVAGVSVKDSEIHGESGINWGPGNAVRILSYGLTSETDLYGWGSEMPQSSIRTGQKPPMLLAHEYTERTLDPGQTLSTLYTFARILPQGRFAVKGRRVKVRVIAQVENTLAGVVTVRL